MYGVSATCLVRLFVNVLAMVCNGYTLAAHVLSPLCRYSVDKPCPYPVSMDLTM